jgi:hypothetical protein
MGPSADFGGSDALRRCPGVIVILHATLPLSLAEPPDPSRRTPDVLVSARPRSVRIRRELPWSGDERTWMLEVEIAVPDLDPERLLGECEGFLVEGTEGKTIGVVEGIERDGPFGAVSGLVVAAGWFGRKQLRVSVEAIEAIEPLERRLTVVPEAHPPAHTVGDSRS